MSQTITITLEFEVKMVHPGYPGRSPHFSYPGVPPEPPELEIENISFEDAGGTSMEELYKKYKAGTPKGVAVKPFDQFVIDEIYNRVLDKAYDLDWSEDENDYDPTP